MDKTKQQAILIVVLLSGMLLIGDFLMNDRIMFGLFDTGAPTQVPGTVPEGTEFSIFKFTGTAFDATTSVTGSSVRAWYDSNGDGVMQYSELGTFTESSGVYTSDMEYPIGVEFDIYVQSVTSSYDIAYGKFHMTGVRNSDGSAKSVGTLYSVDTDDAGTWDGSCNGAAFDTTDYNATTSGTSGNLKAEYILSAADLGVTSQLFDLVPNYMTVYGIIKPYPYYINWANIVEGTNDAVSVADSNIMAGTFFAAYCTIQDKVDLAIDVTDCDLNFNDGVNWYFISFMDGAYDSGANDWFYNTADAVAPRPYFDLSFGTATAAGTFLATYGIGLWAGVDYDAMASGSWTKGTALALGTCGDAWGWVV